MCTTCRTSKDRPHWIPKTFAWGIEQVMRVYEPLVAARKRDLFGDLQGTVLEIGPGTGPNLKYFPKDISWTGVESNPHMRKYLERNARKHDIDVHWIDGSAMSIPLPDESVDYVVGSLVLCSVENPELTLKEVHRVLKPGGEYRFIEHVYDDSIGLNSQAQRLARNLWHYFADGCNIDRKTWETIKSSDLNALKMEHFRIPFPLIAPHICGIAKK